MESAQLSWGRHHRHGNRSIKERSWEVGIIIVEPDKELVEDKWKEKKDPTCEEGAEEAGYHPQSSYYQER